MGFAYPTIPHAVVLLAETNVRLAGNNRTFTLSVLDAGPFGFNGPALIPQASVIQAAHYGDLGRPTNVVELSIGDVVYVHGFGCFTIERGTPQNGGNADWPKLIPAEGPRYFVTFEGQERYAIRDRLRAGAPVAWEDRNAAREAVWGDRPSPVDATRREFTLAVAAYLNVIHPID